MQIRKFVAYLRVSTSRQGLSGLGLEAQREAVARYLQGPARTLYGEFVEFGAPHQCDADCSQSP